MPQRTLVCRLRQPFDRVLVLTEQTGDLLVELADLLLEELQLLQRHLHQGLRYEERGPAVTKQSKQKRTTRIIRQLRSLGYRIEPPNPQPSQALAR
jgi:hypothetical protein